MWDPVRGKGRYCVILPDLDSSLMLTLGRVFEASKSFPLPARVPSILESILCPVLGIQLQESKPLSRLREEGV